MNKFHFNVTIETKTANEAEEKVKSLVILASKLSARELAKLAAVVANDPVKTALAKKYLGV